MGKKVLELKVDFVESSKSGNTAHSPCSHWKEDTERQ